MQFYDRHKPDTVIHPDHAHWDQATAKYKQQYIDHRSHNIVSNLSSGPEQFPECYIRFLCDNLTQSRRNCHCNIHDRSKPG